MEVMILRSHKNIHTDEKSIQNKCSGQSGFSRITRVTLIISQITKEVLRVIIIGLVLRAIPYWLNSVLSLLKYPEAIEADFTQCQSIKFGKSTQKRIKWSVRTFHHSNSHCGWITGQ